MRATIVTLAETGRAGTLSVPDFFDGPLACAVCGFAPAHVAKRGRPDPQLELLEPGGVNDRDPLQRSVYRCRDLSGCEARRRWRDRV